MLWCKSKKQNDRRLYWICLSRVLKFALTLSWFDSSTVAVFIRSKEQRGFKPYFSPVQQTPAVRGHMASPQLFPCPLQPQHRLRPSSFLSPANNVSFFSPLITLLRSSLTVRCRIPLATVVHYLTNPMKQSPSSEANTRPATNGIPCLLRNLDVHYRVNKSLPLISVLSLMNLADTLIYCFLKIDFSVVRNGLFRFNE